MVNRNHANCPASPAAVGKHDNKTAVYREKFRFSPGSLTYDVNDESEVSLTEGYFFPSICVRSYFLFPGPNSFARKGSAHRARPWRWFVMRKVESKDEIQSL